MKRDYLYKGLVAIMFAILGLSFLGSMGKPNSELHKAQIRRAQAEARLLDEQAATERWERAVRKQERIKRATEEHMQEMFGWTDDLRNRAEKLQQQAD